MSSILTALIDFILCSGIFLWNIIIQYVRQTTLYQHLFKKTNKVGINQYLNEFWLRNDYYVYGISWFHCIK